MHLKVNNLTIVQSVLLSDVAYVFVIFIYPLLIFSHMDAAVILALQYIGYV